MKGYFEKMKKFVLAFGIPVLAVASLIGSGYATWYFNTTIDPKNEEIELNITERAVGAKFQHPEEENIKLVLDQSKKMMVESSINIVRVFILKELSVSLW